METGQLKHILKLSIYSSLFLQFITGAFGIYAKFLPVSIELSIIKKMLDLEIFVQIVEGAFYVWFASIFSYVHNVTPNRYYDWVITTPTMLFTFCLYLDYLGEDDKNKKEQFLTPENKPILEHKKSVKNTTLLAYLKDNLSVFMTIFLLNMLMLIFGYLGESGELDNRLSVGCGFLPFIAFFAIIYDKFAKYSSFNGKIIYWIFFTIWALYGAAALTTYYWKNIFYNILDLLAKNVFGLVLAYTLYMNAVN